MIPQARARSSAYAWGNVVVKLVPRPFRRSGGVRLLIAPRELCLLAEPDKPTQLCGPSSPERRYTNLQMTNWIFKIEALVLLLLLSHWTKGVSKTGDRRWILSG